MDGAFPSQKGQSFDSSSGGGYGGRGGGRRGFRGTAENAKTKLCTRWLAGDCRFGDRCNFAHGEQELRKIAPNENGGGGPPGGRFGGGRGRGGYGYGGRGGGPGGPGGYRPQGMRQGGYPGSGYGGQGGYGGGYGMEGGQGGYGGQGGEGVPMQGAGARGGGGGQDNAWAASGFPVQGPNGWFMYRDATSGDPYYHNHKLGITQWERPAEWPMSGPNL